MKWLLHAVLKRLRPKGYFVEANEKEWLIARYFKFDENGKHATIKFRVFELNFVYGTCVGFKLGSVTCFT